ncbi:gas vesicle protein [Halococcus dombrowskii]|uniref:Gas vesicle protein n=1 Tax=Halococcus dombrowskii TaxID=179637 RepID=A0AAV3SEI9_HALDO|nr:gas vesicle protein [Halococcus dombrowskii]UOO96126.1 gas vesicle protein [Halococcus dombrowskii]
MSNSGGPTRQSDSLADVVEMLLDKGVVINADIVVSIGDTELLGVQLRAAIASFETAAEYGLEFPDGTDMRRVEQASDRSELEDDDTVTVEGSEEDDAALDDGEESDTERQSAPELSTRPNDGARAEPAEGGGDVADGDEGGSEGGDDEDASGEDADGESVAEMEQAEEDDAAAEEADDDD